MRKYEYKVISTTAEGVPLADGRTYGEQFANASGVRAGNYVLQMEAHY